MKYLFIGGIADGKWIETQRQEYYRVPVPCKSFASLEAPSVYERTAIDIHDYRLNLFREADGTDVAFYVWTRHEGKVLQRLVENYRPGTAIDVEPCDYGRILALSEEDAQKVVEHAYRVGDLKATIVLPAKVQT